MNLDAAFQRIFHSIVNHTPKVFYALIILIVLDYITGVCLAVQKKQLSSKIGAKGIAGKVMIFVIVALSAIVGNLLLGDGSALCTMTILFYCANEVFSILENACRMGIALPQKLVDAMKALRDRNK